MKHRFSRRALLAGISAAAASEAALAAMRLQKLRWQTGSVSPGLGALSLSPNTAIAGTPYTGTISGATLTSTIAATSSDGTTLTVTGTGTTRTLSGTFAAAGTPTISLVETLAGTVGSPKTTSVGMTVASSGLAGPFDATMAVRSADNQWVDLSSLLASVPTGNKVTMRFDVASGVTGFTLTPWQYPFHPAAFSYAYAKRELAKRLRIQTSGLATGTSQAALTCTYNNGAGETGSPVTWKLGIDVANPQILSWNYGAKSAARCGGPLITTFGDGTGAAIVSQVDKNSNPVSAFEVFHGRIVWKSSNAADGNHYGTARTVSTATSLTQTPYTVTLDNGAVVTINAIGGQWDIAPAPAAVLAAMGNSNGDQYLNSCYNKTFALNDVVMFEDGTHNPSNTSISIVFGQAITGLNAGTGPQAPSGWNIIDTEQSGWIKHTSRNPLGASIAGYAMSFGTPSMAGVANGLDAGCAAFRFTNLVTRTQIVPNPYTLAFSNSQGHICWFQIDGCYMDVTALISRTTINVTQGFFSSGSHPNGQDHMYVHDNWTKGNVFPCYLAGSDMECVGNRFEYASEDAVRWGGYDAPGSTTRSKVWWNTFPYKWWGNSSHPDYIQTFLRTVDDGRLPTLYPVASNTADITTYTSTIPVGSSVGNIGWPDTVNDHNTDTFLNAQQGANFVPTNNGTVYQLDDGEGYLGGDVLDGVLYTWLQAGNCDVSVMANGYFVKYQSPDSRCDMITMVGDWYRPTVMAAHGYADLGHGEPAYKINGNPVSYTKATVGSLKNSIFTGGIGFGAGVGTLTTSNVNSATYDTTSGPAAGIFANPVTNWSNVTRIQEVIDALQAQGAEAGRGAFSNKSKVDHRERTFDTTMFA